MKTLVAFAFIIFISSAVAYMQPPSPPRHGLGHAPRNPADNFVNVYDNKVIERFVSSFF